MFRIGDRHIRLRAFVCGLIASAMLAVPLAEAAEGDDRDRGKVGSDRLAAVRTFAQNALEKGRDRWSGHDTPLLADGINVRTGEPVEWIYNGERFIVHNLASQQNLFRTLTGLSNLTNEPRYRQAAERAVRYHFEHLRSDCGLLRWGGHQFIDLRTLEPVGHFDADCHEFKINYPFYELMWQVEPDATRQFLHAFWNAHILDWGNLDMNRHGPYGLSMGRLWDHQFEQPEPFFEGQGLTFINAGSDLVFAGGMLYALDGDADALEWSERLAHQYVRARHPDTGLGVYQYSQLSDGRDRALNQFGQEFPDLALEGWVLWGGRTGTIYVSNALMQMELAERLAEDGRQLLDWTVAGLQAFAEHAYDADENQFRPMWADGTDLTGYRLPRGGYYGSMGSRIEPTTANPRFLFSYARAHRLTGDPKLWQVVRSIARGNDLGDLGEQPGSGPALNMQTGASHPYLLFALLEIARTSDDPAYLELAEVVGDNIIESRFHHGFFMSSPQHLHADFDAVEPLALLSLEAALRGEPDAVPVFSGGRGYIHGRFDGLGRTTDRRAIWSQRYKPVAGIELERDALVIRGTVQLEATLQPRDATDQHVAWESSDPDVVEIVSAGDADSIWAEPGRAVVKLRAVSPGSATVTATAADRRQTAAARVTVKPYEDTMLEGISVDGVPLPRFSPDRSDYSVLVATNLDDITLSATPANRDAAVTIDRPGALPGTFTINVAPPGSGSPQTYTVDVRSLLTVNDRPVGGRILGAPLREDGFYRFNRDGDAVAFDPVGIDFDDDTPFTIAVWARMHDDRRFLGMYRWHLQRSEFRTRGNDPIRARTGISGNRPHAIVVTYQPQADGNSAELRLYIDGDLTDATTTTGSALSSYGIQDPRVGMTAHSGGVYSRVDVAEIRFYDRALNKQEVQQFSDRSPFERDAD